VIAREGTRIKKLSYFFNTKGHTLFLLVYHVDWVQPVLCMNIFHTLLSIVFPDTTEQALVRGLTAADMDALLHVSPLPQGVGLTSYRNEHVRALVWEAKYKKNAHAHALMAHVLSEYFSSHYDDVPTLIPIPLSPKRAKERGYNQVEEVLKKVCEDPLMQYDASFLARVRETTPQTQLGRRERLTREAFHTRGRCRDHRHDPHRSTACTHACGCEERGDRGVCALVEAANENPREAKPRGGFFNVCVKIMRGALKRAWSFQTCSPSSCRRILQ
jgi:hypothetical protein